MNYGSVCSGIEGFSVAVDGLGWCAKWFAEIDPFCCDLLEARYPGVPNYGDIAQADFRRFAKVDVVVGGTPCQSFSIQGNRQGMGDARGQLARSFAEIVAVSRPRWVVWENVPHALHVDDGRAFASILRGLVDCGYCCAWRVLDAQYFGVPQRRRRLFLVGHIGEIGCAAAVLFEPSANRKHAETTRKIQARERVDEGAKKVPGVIGWSGDETPKCGLGVVPTLRASQGGEGVGIVSGNVGAKLTITEWERLQGFPDGYTKLDGWSESKRRHALGNSFAVPVMRWIAQGIAAVDAW